MALFSWSMQIIKRSSGRSVVAAAAYRAGERLHDHRLGITHDYRRRTGVEHTEILLPADAPPWTQGIGREALWNAVETAEKRKDAQTARELRIMIPRELGPAERIAVVREYLQRAFVSKGMVADVCWHNKIASDGQEQPHAHVLLTMRPLTPSGFGPKVRHERIPSPDGQRYADGRPVMVASNADSWNCPDYFQRCREDWEIVANAALERSGSAARIDRRSLLERGLSRLPEPALRLAYYLRDLYGTMQQRFGQYQMAKHYQAVERAAHAAFQRMDNSAAPPEQRVHTTGRFFDWMDRQLTRLDPTPQTHSIPRNPDMEH